MGRGRPQKVDGRATIGLDPQAVLGAREPSRFLRVCMLLREDQQLALMEPTEHQQLVIRRKALHRWLNVDKYRQAYQTTSAVFWLLGQVEYNPGITGVLIGDKYATSQEAWDRAWYAYQEQPSSIKVAAESIGAKGMRFRHGGRFQILTARSEAPGIGKGIDRLVCTELGSWPNQQIALTHLFPTVNKRPRSEVIVESTPGEHGSPHHQLTMKSIARDSDSQFHTIFLPWWQDKTCTLPIATAFRLTNEEHRIRDHVIQVAKSLAQEEDRTMHDAEKGYITDEHFMFRRVRLDTEFFGDVRLFAAKYPISIYDGWYTTSAPAIPQEPLLRLLESGMSVDDGGAPIGVAWEEPENDCEYLLCADPNSYGSTGDPSAYTLWHLWDCREVGAWSGRRDPSEFAHDLARIGKRFNNALIVVESNAAACITELVNSGYPNVYFNNDEATHPGFFMTGPGKDRAHRHLVFRLRHAEERFLVRSKAGLHQLLSYDGRGKRRRDHHFDRVITYLLAATVMETMLFSTRPVGRIESSSGKLMRVKDFLRLFQERKRPEL